jgi:hypothetical protein
MTSRERFEAWACPDGRSPESITRSGAGYEGLVTDTCWDAWQASRKQALQEAYDAMFDIKGDKATRFDAQTAVRRLGHDEAPST